jgi:maleylpyruvate isomerase
MDRQNVAVTLPWMWQGTDLVAAVVADLSDAQTAGRSALPGWSRGHVLAHLARNAEAIARLVHWASTGEVTPMYPDLAARAADIEASAHQSADALRADFADTARALDAGFGSLDEQTWRAMVRSALGRELPAAELPWMRIREVWLHAIDLAAGVGFDVIPADLVEVLLDDSTAVVGGKPDCPPVLLRPSDSDRTWTLGTGGTPTTVTGPAAELLAWTIGRPHRLAGKDLPAVPAWL